MSYGNLPGIVGIYICACHCWGSQKRWEHGAVKCLAFGILEFGVEILFLNPLHNLFPSWDNQKNAQEGPSQSKEGVEALVICCDQKRSPTPLAYPSSKAGRFGGQEEKDSFVWFRQGSKTVSSTVTD